MLMGESNYTFMDMIQGVVELSLRPYMQHFTHGKAIKYTKPHQRLVAMFTKALTSKYRLSLNFAELILTKLKAFSHRFRISKNTQNCCWKHTCTLMISILG